MNAFIPVARSVERRYTMRFIYKTNNQKNALDNTSKNEESTTMYGIIYLHKTIRCNKSKGFT